MNKYIASVLFLLFIGIMAKGQVNRYVVLLADKDTAAYKVNEPEAFLSERAIARRLKQGVVVTARDFPVKQDYINILNNLGASVLYKSKWFNAVLVEADKLTVPAIEDQEFVTQVEFVAPGSKPLNGKIKKIKKSSPKKFHINEKINSNSVSTGLQNSMLGINYMHHSGYKGEGILIAIFDGGFLNVDQISYFDHLFDNHQIISTYDFVNHNIDVYQIDNGVGSDHGTGVLSCIGAYETNEFVGAAYESDFILCITEDISSEYRIEEYNWLFAAEFADSAGADIINTSLGYSIFDTLDMNYTYEDMNGETTVISRAADIAAQTGMLVVVSAGNEGNKSWSYITAPADVAGLLAVAAVGSDYDKAAFSSLGPSFDGRIKPDVAALGVKTSVINRDGLSIESNGTSFAAPLITGLAAGFWQANPHLTYTEVISHLKNSGHFVTNPNNDLGYGVPHFKRAQGPILGFNERDTQTFKVLPNPVKKDNFFIVMSEKFTGDAIDIRLIDKNGRVILQKNLESIESDKLLPVKMALVNPGVYILHLTAHNISESVKLVKF